MIDKTRDEISGILSARVQGVHHGETLDWEELEWIDNQTLGSSRIIHLRGNEDLVHSLISDAPSDRVQIIDSNKEKFYFVEITE